MIANEDNVALIVIFNHRYDKNIEIIEKLYKGRFKNIYHLVPFYDGEKQNVIPVYESSFFFQGYIAQGFKHFYNKNFAHYLFIADDMILNPKINARSYQYYLKLSEEGNFIPRLGNMPEYERLWPHNRNGVNYNPYPIGVEAAKEIPSATEAEERLKNFNVANSSFTYAQVYGKPSFRNLKKSFLDFFNYLKDKYINGTSLKKTRYPLVRSYADICVISKHSIINFCHYCGVFAATDLFVELAIPTALTLSAQTIRTEKDLDLKGRALWTQEDFTILDKYNNNLNSLLADFPKDYLYLHPVKLSKWKYEEG